MLSATVIEVDTFNDVVDADDSVTSLREAILEANSNSDDYEIVLDAGTYLLSIRGESEDAAATGDLDVLDSGAVTIIGAGASETTIDAAGLFDDDLEFGDRVFHVHSGAALGVEGVTLTGGRPEPIVNDSFPNDDLTDDSGGAVLVDHGTLNLVDVEVSGNEADDGGGILNIAGNITITDSAISDNAALANFGLGGGLISLDGTVTINNSTFSTNEGNRAGGAIYMFRGAEVTIIGSTFSGNTAGSENWEGKGGGIKSLNGSILNITDSTFSENDAGLGGGIYAEDPDTTVMISGSTFLNNHADINGGGLLHTFRSSITITNSTIADNVAGVFGGGILTEGRGSVMTITDSTFTDNFANSGGGIYSRGFAVATVRGSIIANNTAEIGGGGIVNSASLTITDSTVSGNQAQTEDGGGIFLNGGHVTVISNTTISGNVAARRGGGIVNDDDFDFNGRVDIASSTIIGNHADDEGGGLNLEHGSASLHNTIIAGNTKTVGKNQPGDIRMRHGEVDASSSHNFIGDANSAGGLENGINGNIVGADPAMVLDTDLADNGGPTLTHALLPGSPAIDAGNPDFNPDAFDPPLLFDQRGFDRVANGRVDIGAVEFEFDVDGGGGLIEFNRLTPGSLSAAGQVHEWTFEGSADQLVAVVADPGMADFSLGMIDVELLAPDGTLLASGSSVQAGEAISLLNVTLPEDGIYGVQIRAADGTPDATGAYQLTVWDVVSLELDAPLGGTIDSRQSLTFQVEVTDEELDGTALTLDLSGLSADGTFEMYARRGNLPSRTEFDGASRQPFAENQFIYFPRPVEPGTYYVIVFAPILAEAPADFELAVSAPGFDVRSTDFGTGGNAGGYTIRAVGSNFDESVTAWLTDGQDFELSATDHRLETQSALLVTFDLRGVAPGTYDMIFTNAAGDEALVPDSLTVVAADPDPAAVLPRIVAPAAIRLLREFSFQVVWENTSLNDVPAPLLTVGAPVPIGPEHSDHSFGTRHTFLGTSSQGGSTGLLRPGQWESRTFYAFSGTEVGPYTVFVDRVVKDLSAEFDWSRIRDSLRPDNLTDDQFQPIFEELIARVGTTNGDYYDMLVRNLDLIAEDAHHVPVLLDLELQFAWAAVSMSLTGQIVAQGEGVPLTERRITARNLDTDEVFSTVSLRDGQFVLPALTPGRYAFELEGGVVISDPVDLLQDESLTGLKVDFIQGASLEGNVTTAASGAPVQGARVVLATAESNREFVRSSVTDDRGRYSFEGLPAGTYSVSVSKEGLSLDSQQVVVEEGDSELTADLVVEEAGSARVAVLDKATGAPVVNAFVFVLEKNNPAPIRTLQTDDEGIVRFDDLPGGTYDIQAAIAGLSSESQVSVSVIPGETRMATLDLVPVGSVAGRVVDDKGEPLAGVRIGVLAPGRALVNDGFTNADGRFELGELAPGDYTAQIFTTMGIPLASTDVKVVSGEVAAVGELTVGMVGVVEGTVSDEDGMPLADTVVVAVDDAGNEIIANTSNAAGEFRLGFLEAGTYRFIASSSEATFAPVDVPITDGTSSIEFSAGGRTVSGIVHGPDGQPVDGATVLALLFDPHSDTTQVVETITNSDGRFELAGLIDGSYELRVQWEGLGFASADVEVAGADVNGLTLEAAEERTIAGTILEPNGEPLTEASVQVFAAGQAEVLATVLAEPDGTFLADGLPPGNYDVTAIAFGLTVGRLENVDLTAGSADGQSIQVGESGTSVTGTITTSNGDAVAGVGIVVRDASGRWVGLAESNPDGSFQIDNLAAEELTLEVQIDGYAASTTVIDLSSTVSIDGANPTLTPLALELTAPMAESLQTAALELAPLNIVPGWLRDALREIPRSPNEPERPVPPECDDLDLLIAFNEAKKAHDRIDEAYQNIENWQQNLRNLTAANFGLVALRSAKLAGDISSLFLAIGKLKGAAKAVEAAKTAGDFRNSVGAVNDAYRSAKSLHDSLVNGAPPGDLQPQVESLLGHLATLFRDAGEFTGHILSIKGILDEIGNLQDAIDDLQDIISFHDALIGAMLDYEQMIDQVRDKIDDYNALDDDCEEEPDDEEDIQRPVSFDPNDITGPAGFGPQNYIVASDPMPYLIRFENDPEEATAPAAEVTITQTLDDDLDSTTFRLGDIGFGETIVDVPDNTAFFETRVDVTADLGVFVDITAGLDIATGEVSWEFTSIDPETGELPDDPFVGFLPPNENAPEGEGFVNYTIDPIQTVTTGDRVDAEASIVFDVNEPILTPAVFHTFDTAPPSSEVLPLPDSSPTEFEVTWTGSDDEGGSGIAAYDIYVSVNSGPYELWLENTPDASATYAGVSGTTYSFYSQATDNVGHLELAPTTADASTTAVADQNPPSAVNDSSVTFKNQSVDIDVLGNDSDPDGALDPSSVEIVLNPTPSGSAEVLEDGIIRFTPAEDFSGDVMFSYVVSDDQGTTSNVADVSVRVQNSRWQNPLNSLDVNDDQFVTPIDALLVINYLNSGDEKFLPLADVTPPPYLDSNGDELVTPIDALLVINRINENAVDGGAEGEASPEETARHATASASSEDFAMPMVPQWAFGLAAPIVAPDIEHTLERSPVAPIEETLASDHRWADDVAESETSEFSIFDDLVCSSEPRDHQETDEAIEGLFGDDPERLSGKVEKSSGAG